MTDRQPTAIKNLDGYGQPPLEWSRAHDNLAAELTKVETPVYLGTVRHDGRPHAAGIGALWLEGDVYITSSPNAQKARNLAANPACTLAMRVPGMDLIFEGSATRVTDRTLLDEIRKGFNAGGWPAELTPEGDAFTAPFNAPSAGPPPYHVYRFRFQAVFGVATVEPHGATKWTFAD